MPKKIIRSAESFTVVLGCDRALPPDQQSRFVFRPLTQAEKMAVLDGLNWVHVHTDGSQEIMPRSFRQARELVMAHLEEAHNFPTDGPIPWPAKGSEAERGKYLEMLEEGDLLELGNAVRYQAQPGLAVALGATEGTGADVPNS